ncbi:CPBP family intramembrane glutamic endopeptidase [Nannocystis radixulma]|uniref:CPBP family intramembrane metalloprotease n=1 Tax=Nannocystis radixulma TaxID=2995305 RepID=A0ABT5B2S1_9BACT|nr:CPBP family intramembrane glutamic endopeptidase [Nannocystis radixulma]MDC0668397.1 CPBP family intramembrane metalloprotease [Nannocystis radixulma]
MSKRNALALAVIAANVAWMLAFRHAGFVPRDAPVLRGVLLYGPTLGIAAAGLIAALRGGLFTPAELGLRMPAWTLRRGPVGLVLLLIAIFLAGALIDMMVPLGTMAANGMSYDEIVDHLRHHEYRYTYGRRELPLASWDIGVEVFKSVILPPLAEEVPYRALFVPAVLSRLSRSNAALASGVIFFLLHWLVYGAQPHPAYFISGWAFAWAFMLVGLPGSIAAHAGENFGVFMLGTFAAFASSP